MLQVLGALLFLQAAEEVKPHPCPPPVRIQGALCATYPVWENRAAKSGRKINLNILILPATGPEKEPDPVFYLAGGPGQAATSVAPGIGLLIGKVRAKRDLVFVDQRGTGGSNPLECKLYGDPPDLRLAASELFPASTIARCREELEKKADLHFYTTDLAMDDVDEVRAWLGYSKINLVGGSYGTMAAQVYLRRHESTVRSVVLIGVAPVDELIPLHHAMAGQRAVDSVFAECRADAACHAAYPELEKEFNEVLARVKSGGKVEIHDPRDGSAVTVQPGLPVLAEGIRHYLYSTDGRSLPKMIHQAYQGDLAPLVQMTVNDQISFSRALDYGLLLSVSCSEHVPFIRDDVLKKETAGTFLGEARVRAQQRACRQWVQGEVPPDVHKLVNSSVPVLLLSGERDSVTPPSFGERVAKGLENGKHVIFPHLSHGNFGLCGAQLVTAFVEAGSTDKLDLSCVQATPAPKFEVPTAVR